MMILYGGRLSPFVRRVELWLAAQERPVERRLGSVFDENFGGLLEKNPLGRVPVLETEDGTSLFETATIIDYLEDTAPPERRLIPASGLGRWRLLQAIGLAQGVTEKTVALVYERIRRPQDLQWPEWGLRLETQIRNGLTALDAAVGTDTPPGSGLGISAVCAYDMATCKFPALVGPDLVNLGQLSERANALPAFAATYPPRS